MWNTVDYERTFMHKKKKHTDNQRVYQNHVKHRWENKRASSVVRSQLSIKCRRHSHSDEAPYTFITAIYGENVTHGNAQMRTWWTRGNEQEQNGFKKGFYEPFLHSHSMSSLILMTTKQKSWLNNIISATSCALVQIHCKCAVEHSRLSYNEINMRNSSWISNRTHHKNYCKQKKYQNMIYYWIHFVYLNMIKIWISACFYLNLC